MRTYDSYKDSGIEWIGEIPRHWKEKQTKWFFQTRSVKCLIDEPLLSVTQDKSLVKRDDNDIRVWNPSSDISGYKLVDTGDFVISLRSFEGGIENSDIRGLVSPAYSVFHLKSDYVSYRNYFRVMFKSIPFISELNKYTSGIRQGKNISYEDFSSILFPLPPLSEQEQIVSYLDEKTSLIDEMIEKKKRKIELLKEYRTSLINTVVTKGLNPDVPMKDSGIEWIGEIPRHWISTPLKHLCSIENGKEFSSIQVESGGYPVYGTGGEFSRCSEFLYHGPSVLLGRKGTIDKPILVYEPFWTSDTIYYTVIKTMIKPEFMFYQVCQIPFSLFSYGSTIPSMTKSHYENMRFPLPPLSEQEQIVTYLDEKTSEIDKTIELEKKKIELLKEYRQSLISNVVTGKIKVVSE
jgi:type I restriction enzyme S subunit